MKVKIDGLADAVADALREYHEDVSEDVKRSVVTAADTCVKVLKATSPNLTGDYAKSWKKLTAFENAAALRLQVHSEKEYRLTHLLENGHDVKDSHGVVIGKAPPYPHIGPAAEKAGQRLMKDVKLKVGLK